MNVYWCKCDFHNYSDSYYEPPESGTVFSIVIAETRGKAKSLFFTSHNIDEFTEIRAVIIDKGINHPSGDIDSFPESQLDNFYPWTIHGKLWGKLYDYEVRKGLAEGLVEEERYVG